MVGFGLSYQYYDHVFSLRFQGAIDEEEYSKDFHEFAFMYGRGTQDKRGLLTFGVGPGMVSRRMLLRGCVPSSVNTLGLSLEAQMILKPCQILGFGALGFVFVGADYSTAGLMMTTQLGKLW
jgi:hypothetical protein